MKKSHCLLLALTILLPLAIAAAVTGTVFGQYCGFQVGSMTATSQYAQGYLYGQYNPYNIQLTVPISTNCTNMGPQLWGTGTVFDTVTNTNLGSNNVVMNSNNGYYAGQLVFTVPSSVIQHELQVQIQVYNGYNNGQYTGLVASSSPTVTIHANSYYYQPAASYYNGYPNGYYNGYYYYYNGNYYYYYPYYYYYSYPYYYGSSSCFNGQAIIYYNGAYYYTNCYWYRHH